MICALERAHGSIWKNYRRQRCGGGFRKKQRKRFFYFGPELDTFYLTSPSTIIASCETLESIQIQLALKRSEFGLTKVSWHDYIGEFLGLADAATKRKR
jgi:hypothetical protein